MPNTEPHNALRNTVNKAIADGAPVYENVAPVSQNGTDGRVYGGDCNLVHIADGQRKEAGKLIAQEAEAIIRGEAWNRIGNAAFDNPLCPGCFMIALFNAAIHLADSNGQSRVELGATMSAAFEKLAEEPHKGLTEEIEVILD